MENKDYGAIIGSPKAPYINSLAASATLADHYYALHSASLPNYLGLISGSRFGLVDSCVECHFRARNIVDQLEAAHLSWKGYMEGLPTPCYSGAQSGMYVKRHNPFFYFDDVIKNPARCSKIVSFSDLSADLAAGNAPMFMWLTPDVCHDMHSCSVADGDRFLAGLVPRLLAILGPSGVLFLTWDEGFTTKGCCDKAMGGHVPLIVAGPAARAGFRSKTSYDHYSVLRTIEEAWGMPLLADAGCSCTPPILDAFQR